MAQAKQPVMDVDVERLERIRDKYRDLLSSAKRLSDVKRACQAASVNSKGQRPRSSRNRRERAGSQQRVSGRSLDGRVSHAQSEASEAADTLLRNKFERFCCFRGFQILDHLVLRRSLRQWGTAARWSSSSAQGSRGTAPADQGATASIWSALPLGGYLKDVLGGPSAGGGVTLRSRTVGEMAAHTRSGQPGGKTGGVVRTSANDHDLELQPTSTRALSAVLSHVSRSSQQLRRKCAAREQRRLYEDAAGLRVARTRSALLRVTQFLKQKQEQETAAAFELLFECATISFGKKQTPYGADDMDVEGDSVPKPKHQSGDETRQRGAAALLPAGIERTRGLEQFSVSRVGTGGPGGAGLGRPAVVVSEFQWLKQE